MNFVSSKKILSIIVFSLILTACSTSYNSQKVDQLGEFKVGDDVQSFSAVYYNEKDESIDYDYNNPSGDFYVYFIHNDLDYTCLNTTCLNSDYIQSNGGQLMGGSDGKLANSYNAFKNDAGEKDPNASVLVIADESLKIIAMYKYVEKEEVDDIVKRELNL